MTIDEGNALIAKFVGINLGSDGKTYLLPEEYQQILKYKTTQFLHFNDSFDLLFLAIKKICIIKDLWYSQQFEGDSCYICLYYKADLIEGDWRNAKFSCERTKPLDKLKQAIFEVLSTFCGWYYNNPECSSDIKYDFSHTLINGIGERVIYLKPEEVICPKCKSFYYKDDENIEKNKVKNDINKNNESIDSSH